MIDVAPEGLTRTISYGTGASLTAAGKNGFVGSGGGAAGPRSITMYTSPFELAQARAILFGPATSWLRYPTTTVAISRGLDTSSLHLLEPSVPASPLERRRAADGP